MFQDVKAASMSPSKGKAKEETHWRSGWWDFHPLIEHPHRPIEWTNSSVIFTAHPTQPIVTARHFSSSKQFMIPSPSPIIASAASYEPPSVISIAPTDDWLFAYFPQLDSDGIACLWQRGPQVDRWNIKEWWSFPSGGGVVAARWLGTPREWAPSQTGLSRLPPLGPRTPVSSPTLLLVTQDHQVNVCYLRHYIPTLKIIKCSLIEPGVVAENQPNPVNDGPIGPGVIRQCMNAAIGLGYNESSILVAMRSHCFPLPTATPAPFTAMNMDLSLDVTQPPVSEDMGIEWETWGEETTIDLCEIQLRFDGSVMAISANPLPPIHKASSLSNMIMICTPPAPVSSPDPTHSPSRKPPIEKGKLYLVTSFLDFGNYTSTPNSELLVYSIARQAQSPGGKINKNPWATQLEQTQSFSMEVAAFIAPGTRFLSDRPFIYAGMLDTSGSLSKRSSKVKEVPVGSIKVLTLPDLSESLDWESSFIVSSPDSVGRNSPVNVAVSPNGTLLCTTSSSPWTAHTSIYTLPKRSKNMVTSSGLTRSPSAASLASAIFMRRTTTDITHVLCKPSTPLNEAVDVLYHCLAILDSYPNGLSVVVTSQMLGVLVDIYRKRARQADQEADQEMLTARWKVAHDMCSVSACNTGFLGCRDGEGFDLDAVWQLIGLSGWVLEFTERLMKQCVLSCDLSKQDTKIEPSNATGDDLFGSGESSPAFPSPPQPLDSPILLNLVHPYALLNLTGALDYVKSFRSFLGSQTPRGENAQIARDVFVDLVDCSGIDLSVLVPLLRESVPDAMNIGIDELRRGLAACQPTVPMRSHLQKVIQKITERKVIDRPALFLKPHDLVDGIARLSMSAQRKEKAKDIVTKALLVGQSPQLTCLRCGGKTELGTDARSHGSSLTRWRAWEKTWQYRCVCGGPWASVSSA